MWPFYRSLHNSSPVNIQLSLQHGRASQTRANTVDPDIRIARVLKQMESERLLGWINGYQTHFIASLLVNETTAALDAQYAAGLLPVGSRCVLPRLALCCFRSRDQCQLTGIVYNSTTICPADYRDWVEVLGCASGQSGTLSRASSPDNSHC